MNKKGEIRLILLNLTSSLHFKLLINEKDYIVYLIIMSKLN